LEEEAVEFFHYDVVPGFGLFELGFGVGEGTFVAVGEFFCLWVGEVRLGVGFRRLG